MATTCCSTYTPLRLEAFQISEDSCNIFIGKIGLVLLEEAVACLGVLSDRDRVLQVGPLEGIKRDYDAVDLCKRLI